MINYSNEQLAGVIALPIVSILLLWTAAIFRKHHKNWAPYDIPVVAILVLSIIRNLTVLSYILFLTLHQNTIDIDYCSGVIWIFNSIHTFQASCLTTLAIIGLFSVKLCRKQQHLRQFLTATHVIYHLFCLTTLCACVGVAAILAQNGRSENFKNLTVFDSNPCRFLPFDLDIKFNVFIIVLHVFLATVSLISFFVICFNHYKIKRKDFEYMKKSNSDLSNLSLDLVNDNKNYYDTYMIQRGPHQMDQSFCENQNNNVAWNSDVSNMSATVSSTNSRRPCIAQKLRNEHENRTGLETIHPVLIVCYLFYHLPLIVLSIHPNLVTPWPVAGVALWLGLVQDILIPIGLSIVDTRFCKWVSNVYKCSDRHGDDKLPHVGLDGKFRPFCSQPQSLEIQSQQVRASLQGMEHRFPITNGSLYTSIDGRLPVIHNYRRHKDQKTCKPQDAHQRKHQNHLSRPSYFDSSYQPSVKAYACRGCETDLCPSHSNLHHLNPHYINKQVNLIQENNNILISKNALQKGMSLSQDTLRYSPENACLYNQYQDPVNNPIIRNSRNLLRLNKIRLCKSEDSLNDMNNREMENFKENLESRQKDMKKNKNVNEQILDYSSSDEDYLTDINNDHSQPFDSLSSRSSYSITTEANCDFEFYQNEDLKTKMKTNDTNSQGITFFDNNSPIPFKTSSDVDHKNLRIKRSDSKRSLENLQAYIEEKEFPVCNKVQRSNSYMTLEDRRKKRNCKKIFRSNSKLSDCTHNIREKIKSVEYLPNSNSSTVYIEDVFYFNYPSQKKSGEIQNYVGSVPDLKKIFISEYI